MLRVKTFTFNPVQENTYILYNEENQCCIIDPGCYFNEEKKELSEFIETSGLQPVLLLNTHCHLDHVFGNKFIHEKYGLVLHIHEKERPVLEYAPSSALMWQMPFENYEGEPNYLKEGETMTLGKDELAILFTPGHSPGSVSFYCKPGKFVVSGDVLFSGSIGRTDLPGADFNTLFQSIQTQLFVLPDEVVVFPGHGPSTSIGLEKMNNPFVKVV